MTARNDVLVTTCLLGLLAACQANVACGSAVAGSKNTASLTINADLTQMSIELAYRFRFPVQALEFRYKPELIRRNSWNVRDALLMLKENAISHANGDLIETVILDIGLDKDSFDRVYPSLRPAGNAGIVFFTDYAMLEGIELSEILVSTSPGNVVAYSNFVSAGSVDGMVLPGLSKNSGHYLYFGDANLVGRIEGGLFLSDDRLPKWIAEELRQAIGPAVAWLDSYFGSRNSERLFVVATLESEATNTRWRGDVSPNGEIFLRLHGEGWLKENAELDHVLKRFLAHELVHLENGARWRKREGEPAWLSEGLAEYLAIIHGTVDADPDGFDFFQDEVTDHASQCISILRLQGTGMSDPSLQRGAHPYNCGVLAFWVMDGASGPPAAGNKFRSVWSSLVATLEGRGKEYGVSELLSALDANEKLQEKRLLTALIEGPGDNQWENLKLMFSEIGLVVTYEYNDAWARLARSSLITHVLDLHCESGRRGFWTYDDHIQFDTDERCGPLSGNPKVDTMQGFSIVHEMQDAYRSAQQACRKGDDIEFGVVGSSEKLLANCSRPIAEAPPFVVLRMETKDGE